MYICRHRSDEWSNNLHKGGFEDLRCRDRDISGDDQHLLVDRRRRRGADLRLDRAALHHYLRLGFLFPRCATHGRRRQLRVLDGRAVRGWNRHGLRPHDSSGVCRRGVAGGGARLPHYFPGSLRQCRYEVLCINSKTQENENFKVKFYMK